MGTPVQSLHSRERNTALPHCRRAGAPARTPRPRAEPLLIYVAFLAVKQGISVTCVKTCSTSSAESAIVRSVHRLLREFIIHDCNVGPIT